MGKRVADMTPEEHERAKARCRAWHEANRECANARRKAWHEANRERAEAYQRAWYEANRERVKADKKVWCEANRERAEAYRKAYAESHPEVEVRSRLRTRNGIENPPDALVDVIVANRRLKRLIEEKGETP